MGLVKAKRASYSKINTFKMCPRKHELSYVKKLTPKKKDIKLREGSLVGNALGVFYGGLDFDDPHCHPWKNASEAVQQTMKYAESVQDHLIEGDPENEKLKVKLANVMAALKAYMNIRGREDYERYEFKYKEYPIRMAYGEWELEGYIDFIWKDKSTKVLHIVEGKAFAPGTQGLFDLDMQISIYTLGLLEEYGLLPTLYNVIHKPQFKLNKGEELKDMRERVYSKVLQSPDKYLKRNPYSRARYVLEIADKEIKDILALWDAGHYPIYRNVGQHCNWGCSFGDICLREDPSVLVQKFDVRVRCEVCGSRDQVPYGKEGEWQCPSESCNKPGTIRI